MPRSGKYAGDDRSLLGLLATLGGPPDAADLVEMEVLLAGRAIGEEDLPAVVIHIGIANPAHISLLRRNELFSWSWIISSGN